MTEVIRQLSDMTDSRELMEAKTHPFITWFFAGLVVILLVALTWCYYGEIDIVVKANGVVRPNDNVIKITSRATGKVESVSFKAGQSVRAGDILYTLEREKTEADQISIEQDLADGRKEMAALLVLRKLITDNPDGMIELEDIDYYLTEPQIGAQKLELQIRRATQLLNENKERLQQLQLLDQSIKQRSNQFQEENVYSLQYTDYELKLQQLQIQVDKATDVFLTGISTNGEADEAKRLVDEAILSLDNYKNDFKFKLEEQFLSTTQSLNELEDQQNGLFVQLNETIRTKEIAIKRLEEDERSINQSLDELVVVAPQDGLINVIRNLEIGDLVQAGTEILTVVPANNSEYIVQLAVQNKDIANIKQDDQVEFSFLALSSKEYGHLEGSLTLINSDATIDQQSGASYYAVEAALNNKTLYNNKGEQAEIKTGMLTEARIITRSEKILYYLLEKIDLRE
jgi:HlyD family type I secretion membrane fusion protein